MQKILHTPDGVRDVYNSECAKKRRLRHRIHRVFEQFGYQDIETPTFEFFDVFSREIGTVPSRDLYKFFDREGNTLVLRPDFTPSIARAASMYFTEEKNPIRLCYQGNTFVNNSSFQGRLKEATEMGVEFLGDSSVESDAEILALTVELIKKAGLADFQISVGHVAFFNTLVEEAGLTEETQTTLRELIENKNYFGVEELVKKQNLSSDLESALLHLPQLYGSTEIFDKARQITGNQKALEVLTQLEELYKILSFYGCENYISFDLGMLTQYRYYTGIIFQAYTYGTGDSIVKGGRYDSLLAHFGHSTPAIGFAIVIENLMKALSRQEIELEGLAELEIITFTEETKQKAIEKAMKLRARGVNVELRKEDTV
ncbi:MAG: ATP phosphoribosyltransferase regulatory subunit [Lachnospiraceae bacterium]